MRLEMMVVGGHGEGRGEGGGQRGDNGSKCCPGVLVSCRPAVLTIAHRIAHRASELTYVVAWSLQHPCIYLVFGSRRQATGDGR